MARAARAPLPTGFLAAPVAHRGLHDREAGVIENSRAAVRTAVAAGYGVEIDVQLSADGEAMVFHDAALDRLTAETGVLRDRTAAELAAIPLAGAADDETIPRLSEILALMKRRSSLVVEIKDQGGALDAGGVGPLEARVAALLSVHVGPVAVMSFNPASVAEIARAAPALPRGLVACAAAGYDEDLPPARLEELAELSSMEETGAAFFSYDWRALPTARTRALRAAGAAALCWTVRDARAARTARDHADQITFEGFRP